MNNKGYTGKELLIVIMIMGVLTIGIIGFTSNAYKDKTGDYYNELVHSMEKQAALYGNTLDSLKEEGNLMITLDDVIKGYSATTERRNNNEPTIPRDLFNCDR